MKACYPGVAFFFSRVAARQSGLLFQSNVEEEHPKMPQQVRITSPTIALFRVNGHHQAQTVPVGTVIRIVDGKPFDGERLMDVEWDGKIVMMFTQDLRLRTEEVA